MDPHWPSTSTVACASAACITSPGRTSTVLRDTMIRMNAASVTVLTLALAVGAAPAWAKNKAAKPSAATAAKAEPVAITEKPAGPPPAGSSPMAELKKSNQQLDKVLQKNRP